MRLHAVALALASALGIGMNMACASGGDVATIVNSGSTNAVGYRIDVRSDGTGTVATGGHHGAGAMSSPKPFSLDPKIAAAFFADLKAAQAANPPSQICMKSASFGTTTKITWQTWTSPDLECPASAPQIGALIRDVAQIRQAAGVSG